MELSSTKLENSYIFSTTTLFIYFRRELLKPKKQKIHVLFLYFGGLNCLPLSSKNSYIFYKKIFYVLGGDFPSRKINSFYVFLMF